MATYICRPCAIALRHVRQFSVSAAKRSSLQVPRSSDPELDNVFRTLRDKHFIPASLNKQQRQLIFDPKREAELENSPIAIQVGDEEVELQHIQPYTDVPSRRPLVLKALQLMKDGDFEPLPQLFEAIVSARGTVDSPLLEKAIRLVTQAGRWDIALRCLRRPEATGFTFKHLGVLREVVKSLQVLAQHDGWTKEGLEKASQCARSIAAILENKQHIGARDPRTIPEVLGLYLELAAVQAHKYQGNSLHKYLRRTVERLEDYQPITANSQHIFQLYEEFMSKFPLWHGLTVAKMVTEVKEIDGVAKVLAEQRRLEGMVRAVEQQGPHKEGSYGHRVIDTWANRIQG